MPRVSPRVLFDACYGSYAIAAVNVFTMEQVLGLFRGASQAQSPIIVQMTPYARDFASAVMLEKMIIAAAAQFPDVVYATHLDHGTESHCFEAIDSGWYTSVMIDASHESFDRNVERTRAVVRKAHAADIVVEAELGILSGVEDDMSVHARHARYTDPEQCVSFVSETACDSLAVAVGTSHGAYKFSGGEGLQFDILQEIQRQLPRFPLVLHGASAVNLEEVRRINAAGGRLSSDAKGVDTDELRRAITLGVCKVNIATDTRLLWARIYREFFIDHPENIDSVVPGKRYIEAYASLMQDKFALLGSSGKAGSFQ